MTRALPNAASTPGATPRLLLLLLLPCLLLSADVHAQGASPWTHESLIAIDPSLVAARAPDLASFVPAGWVRGLLIEGDLTSDGVADAAWLMCSESGLERLAQEPTCGACAPRLTVPCALAVARREASGWSRIGLHRHVPHTTESSLHGLDIDARGILHVHYTHGGHYSAAEYHWKYRWQRSHLRMRLIGLDSTDRSQNDPDEEHSTNWLTRRDLLRRCHFDNTVAGDRRCEPWRQGSRPPPGWFFLEDGWTHVLGPAPGRRLWPFGADPR